MNCTFTASTLKWKYLLLSICCSLQAPLSFLGSSFLVTVLFSPRIFQSCFSVLKGNSVIPVNSFIFITHWICALYCQLPVLKMWSFTHLKKGSLQIKNSDSSSFDTYFFFNAYPEGGFSKHQNIISIFPSFLRVSVSMLLMPPPVAN